MTEGEGEEEESGNTNSPCMPCERHDYRHFEVPSLLRGPEISSFAEEDEKESQDRARRSARRIRAHNPFSGLAKAEKCLPERVER